MSFKKDPLYWGAKTLQVSLVLALFPLFFIRNLNWTDGLFLETVWNLGHILFFFVITLLLQPQRRLAGWRLVAATSVAVLVSGGIIEVIQGGIGREIDWHDMLRNLVGAWLALACLSWPEQKAITVWLGRGGVFVLLLGEVLPVAATGMQRLQINRQVPQLYDFAAANTQAFWSGDVQRSTRFADSIGQYSLQVNIGTERYSGATLNKVARDWSNYQNLTLALFNPERTPLTMVLRINDRAHDRSGSAYDDRFNTRLVVAPGLNHFNVLLADVQLAPASRLMNMTDIRGFMLFASNQATPISVYVFELNLH